MSDVNNPYGGFGGQMTAQAHYGGEGAAKSYVKETTTAAFAKDVIEESRRQPVLVDFWAPWCGPCRQLTPMIEKVVNEAAGQVRLVKMNIDDHPSIAGQLGIQSIPAVIAFVDGRPVDGFMGAVPESQIRQFIARLGGGKPGGDPAEEIAAVIAEADGLRDAGDFEGAGQLYGAVLQADPDNIKATAGIAASLLGMGQIDEVRQLLGELPEEMAADPAIVAIATRLAQIEEARKIGDPVALEHQLSLDPDNHEARMKLAKVLDVEGKRQEAAEHLLMIMKRDRSFDDDGARRQLLQFFEVWGPKDPATIAARRKLSSILFS